MKKYALTSVLLLNSLAGAFAREKFSFFRVDVQNVIFSRANAPARLLRSKTLVNAYFFIFKQKQAKNAKWGAQKRKTHNSGWLHQNWLIPGPFCTIFRVGSESGLKIGFSKNQRNRPASQNLGPTVLFCYFPDRFSIFLNKNKKIDLRRTTSVKLC